jgi:kynurenine formamidase
MSDILKTLTAAHPRIIDLTHTIREASSAWPGDTRPFEAQINATLEKNGYFSRRFSMLEHFGTHLDAPAHFAPGGKFVDEIPAERLFGPAVVVDAREESAGDPNYRLADDKITFWESRHGKISPGAIVVMRTGWSAYWHDTARYCNQDATGAMHFPGFSVEAAQLCIARGASGLGIDSMNVDHGASQDFPVHRAALAAGLYHLENLADLTELPESGAFLIVAPIKLAGGSGGPSRVFAILLTSPPPDQSPQNT